MIPSRQSSLLSSKARLCRHGPIPGSNTTYCQSSSSSIQKYFWNGKRDERKHKHIEPVPKVLPSKNCLPVTRMNMAETLWAKGDVHDDYVDVAKALRRNWQDRPKSINLRRYCTLRRAFADTISISIPSYLSAGRDHSVSVEYPRNGGRIASETNSNINHQK